MGLTNKQQLFVEHYARCWNASEAARLAGYSAKTARSMGQQLLTKLDIAAEIKARIAEQVMTPDETMARIAEQARAAYAAYIQDDGKVDLAAMRRDGKMHLVKGTKVVRGELVVEFHDAQAALFKIASVHGLPVERVEVTQLEDAREHIRRRVDRLAERIGAGGDAAPVGPDAVGGGGVNL
jgi:hypothetical protein